MVTTRSTQQSNSHSPTCTQKSEPAAGSKRKAEASPSQITKRRKTISDSDQPQKTLEESFGHAQFPQADKTAPASERGTSKPSEQISKELESHCSNSSTQSAGEQNSHDSKSAIRTSARDDSMPDSVLEKGLIYFFFRGRVGIDEPSATDDVARSYIVLRPIPLGAAIESGHVDPECASYRVLALPKKIFPGSARDQFMVRTRFLEIFNARQASSYRSRTKTSLGSPHAIGTNKVYFAKISSLGIALLARRLSSLGTKIRVSLTSASCSLNMLLSMQGR